MIDDRDETDDRPQTVEEILAEWKAEGPAIAAEMERRQKQIDAAATLAWARQRNAAREAETSQRRDVPADALGQPLGDPRYRLDPNIPIEKQFGPPVTRRAAVVTPGSLSKAAASEVLRSLGKPLTREKIESLPQELQDAVTDAYLSKDEQMIASAVGQMVGDVRRDTDVTIEKLRGRIAELEARLDRLEAAPRSGLRAV